MEWKWEVVIINFINKLPRIVKQHDSIMVVVDKLTKATYFIPVKMTQKLANIANIYMKEIARLHGVPKEIVSYQYSKFTSNFWKGLFKGFDTNFNLSIGVNCPQTNGKIERVNQVIEDMLRLYVMDKLCYPNGKIIYFWLNLHTTMGIRHP
jgi:hypothetical protein